MQTLSIGSKSELSAHAPAIEAMFEQCFGSRMSIEIWRWAYLDNPHGDPFVSLCYDGDALVGHYAMIPLPVSSSGRRLKTCLSMTTMVAATHRQHGLFVKLAEATYANAIDAGVDWVMGFPNAASSPGFERRLQWFLPAPDRVISLERAQLLELAPHLPLADGTRFGIDLDDEATRGWRLSRPGATYQWRDGLAYKEYGDAVDLIGFSHVDQLSSLPEGRRVNLLVPAGVAERVGACEAFDYQFGGRSLGSEFVPTSIVRHMSLSDVF